MSDARVQVDYELHGQVFRMEWSAPNRYELFEQPMFWGGFEAVADGGTWTERFPLRIFSQKQLYGFKDRTAPLLDEVDGTLDVGGAAWQREWDRMLSEFVQLRSRIQTLNGQLKSRGDISAKLADKQRQLEVLEKAGHKVILRELALRRRQSSEVETWTEASANVADQIRDLAGNLAFAYGPLQLSRDDHSDAAAEGAIEQAAQEVLKCLEAEAGILLASAKRIEAAREGWKQVLSNSAFRSVADASEAAYSSLVAQLQGSGAKPEQYGELVQDIQLLQRQMDQLNGVEKQLTEAKVLQRERYSEISAHRKLLTTKRRAFLQAQFGE